MAFARSFVALVALLCFAVVAVVRAQAASGDVTKLQIGVKVREERRGRTLAGPLAPAPGRLAPPR